MTWQPIETAPKDGTETLLWEKGFEVYAVGYFCELAEKWVVFGTHWNWQPTHWMPLPEPPEEA